MSALAAASNTSAPLNRTPSSAARPVPDMIAAGVASPSAHGQAISSTATAWSIAEPGADGSSAHQPRNVASAIAITIGTKTEDTRSASRCTGALEPCADCRSRTISASLVFAPTLVTNTTSRPWPLTDAPTTSSPGPTSTGTDSPVSIERSSQDEPSFTTPSAGTFSPGQDDRDLSGTKILDRDASLLAVDRARSPLWRRAPAGTRDASPALALARASRTLPSRMSVTTTAAVSK